MKKKRLLAVLLILFLLLGSAWALRRQQIQPVSDPISQTGFYLNTVVTITIYDSEDTQLLTDCMKLCEHYENQFSRTIESSEISQLNQGYLADENGTSHLSAETSALLAKGLEYSRLSEGAFDITIGPVSSLWDFTAENPQVPDPKTIEPLLSRINYQKVHLTENAITFQDKQMQLDLGAIAKGFIADRIKDYLLSQNIHSATINLGGNVLCVGTKPDGSAFRIGIQKPFSDRNEIISVVAVEDSSVVTSGTYERCFEKDGVLYHHILDPSTGYPYENELDSVTILSALSVDGDGLSTTCFALGLEKGLALIESLENVEAMFITKDGQLHYSSGFVQE